MRRGWIRLLAALCLALLAACAQTVEIVPEPGTDAPRIPISLYRPLGQGPFPAVVLLHHCGGIRGVTIEWRQRLVEWGYVVAVPDSFATRGFPRGVCGDGTKVTGATRALDAFVALRLLEQQPDVLPDRIAVMGHSHGGVAVLSTVSDAIAANARTRAQASGAFRAAIAYYPWCGYGRADTYGNGAAYRTAVPLLILAGALDDWTPAPPCAELAEGARRAGQPVEITIYPGAHHSFDGSAPLTRVAEARLGKGATIGGNPAAREASIAASRAYLEKHMPGAGNR
jgi:dienelactone hydrolase